jgi:hypothetical protein
VSSHSLKDSKIPLIRRRNSSIGTLRRSAVREEVWNFAINSDASSSECRSISRTERNAIMGSSSLHSMQILDEQTQARAAVAPEIL